LRSGGGEKFRKTLTIVSRRLKMRPPVPPEVAAVFVFHLSEHGNHLPMKHFLGRY
jgi:hypothetical protein